MTFLIFGVSRCNLPNVTGDCTAPHPEGATRKEPVWPLSAQALVMEAVCVCVSVCVCVCERERERERDSECKKYRQ